MAVSPQMIGAGLSAASSLFGGKGGGVSFKPYNTTGPLASATFGKRSINLGLTPDSQALMDQLFGGAALGLESLSDPTQVAQDYFGQAMSLLAPTQEKARTSLENRLFAQGRLSGTGGIGQMGELLGRQEDARTKLAMDSLLRGTSQRGAEIQQALGLFGGGMQLGRLPMELAQLGMSAGESRMRGQALNAELQGPDPLQTALLGAGMAFSGMSPQASLFGGAAVPPPTPGGGVAPGGQIFTGMHGGQRTSGTPWDYY